MRFDHFFNRVLLLILSVLGCLAIVWQTVQWTASWRQERLAQKLAARAELNEAKEARFAVHRLGELGETAFDSLVTAASSQRSEIAEVARQIVDRKIAAWKEQSQQHVSSELTISTTKLAITLADHIDQFDTSGKRWTEHIALQLIQLSERFSASRATDLLDACNRILSSVPPQGPRMRTLSANMKRPSVSNRNQMSTSDVQLEILAVPSYSLLDNDFSAPQTAIRIVGPLSNSPSSTDAEVVLTKPTVDKTPLQLRRPAWSPEWNARGLTDSPLAEQGPETPPNRPRMRLPTQELGRVIDVPTPDQMKRREERLSDVPMEVLFERLLKAEFYEAGAIRAVLRERGFTIAELALIPQLFSENAVDRIQLIDRLSVLPAASARRWLKRLLDDQSAQVRLKALSALATTKDPRLFDLARGLAVADQDDRVAELASRIMSETR